MRSRILAISLLLLIGLVPAIHSPARAAHGHTRAGPAPAGGPERLPRRELRGSDE